MRYVPRQSSYKGLKCRLNRHFVKLLQLTYDVTYNNLTVLLRNWAKLLFSLEN